MAVDVVVDFIADTNQFDTAVSESAKQVDDLSKSEQTAAKKRDKLIREEIKILKDLKKGRSEAFTLKDIEGFNKKIKDSEKRLNSFRSALKEIKKETSEFSSVLQGIGSRLVAAFAIERIISFGVEVSRLAAQAEGVRLGFEKLEDVDLQELTDATKGTVTELELMRTAVQAENFEVPLDKLAKFFRFATLRASETGQSVQQLTNDIVLGIGRQSVKIIDNLGISAKAVREEFARTGDFAQAVANIIDKEFDGAGEAILTDAQRIASFNAEIDNIKVAIGEELNSAIAEMIEFFDEAGDILVEWTTDTNSAQAALAAFNKELFETEEQFKEFEIGILNIQLANLQATLETLNFNNMINEAAKVQAQIDALLAEIERLKTDAEDIITEDAIRNIVNLNIELSALKVIFEESVIGGRVYSNTLEQIREKELELKAATEGTTVAILKQQQAFEDTQERLKAQSKEREDLRINEEEDSEAFFNEVLDDLSEEDAAREESLERRKQNAEDQEVIGKEIADAAQKRFEFEKDVDSARNDLIINSLNNLTDAIRDTEAIRTQIRLSALADRREAEEEDIQAQFDLEKERLEAQIEANEGNASAQKFFNDQRKGLRDEERAEIEANNKKIEKEEKRILTDQAKREKTQALFDIAIQTAIGAAKSVATSPVTFGQPFLSFVIAQGAINAALVAARPLPVFEEGGLIEGGRHAQGGVNINAEGGEYMNKRSSTNQYLGYLQSANDHKLEDYIYNKDILPALQKQENEFKQIQQQEIFNNLSQSIMVNGMSDKRMVETMRAQMKGNAKGFNALISTINRQNEEKELFKGNLG